MTLKGLRYNQQSQPSKSLWRDLTLPWEHLAAVYIHLILEKFALQAQQYTLAQSFNFSPSISALINNYAYFHIMFLHSKVHFLWIISDFLCCWFKIVLWIRNLTLHQYSGGQPWGQFINLRLDECTYLNVLLSEFWSLGFFGSCFSESCWRKKNVCTRVSAQHKVLM